MSQFREGIYLQEKKGTLGTGDTLATVTYKNYYAVRLDGGKVEMYLLDDHLTLTGLRDSLPLPEFRERFQHQPQMQERFRELISQLGPGARRRQPGAEPKSQPAPPPQTRAQAAPPQTRPQAAPPQKRPTPPPPAKSDQETPWWELTQKGAERLVKKD
ncbi:MAG: hypothetical protein PVG60_00480 [Desulfarculaceae bacterium]|jgi:hypothetical protein